jgi:superfamily II DNA or RNA helicase/diadenosine tetraphosphate (Ap4A) HIT family hydrolase
VLSHTNLVRRVELILMKERMETSCPFCAISTERIIFDDDLVMGIWDAFPVTEGHLLIVPKRHVPTWFDLTGPEQSAIMERVLQAQHLLADKFGVADFNVGFNQGEAAGQTVPHFHLHVIPRRSGDVEDPRGGIRHVIPTKANYLVDKISGADFGDVPHARALIAGGKDSLAAHILPHIDDAVAVDVTISFVLMSGVRILQPHFQDLLNRGGRLRVITGDYLDVTDPTALRSLMDLEGQKELFVYEVGQSSFHPKSWIFHRQEGGGLAIVGSSNLSKTALGDGIEWNYRVIYERDRSGWKDVAKGFDTLMQTPQVKPLTNEWVDTYVQRRKQVDFPRIIVADVPDEPILPAPEPHEIQVEALDSLKASREAGYSAGLVVLATGLGKTWLSAFDAANFDRVLFVAHREEILEQAMQTFRLMRPDGHFGRYTGTEKDLGADVLFASIQTLGRVAHLRQFSPEAFDYIIVDEFHHAAARTYRGLIDYFTPRFLLGLTATPERTDGGDLLALCQENLVYRCDAFDGIERGLLSPFHYFGVPDEIDYAQIPWRNKSFDVESLTGALATQARAQNALEQHEKHGGQRTIGFCCSVRHAEFMAEYFRNAGLRAVSVHSGPNSAPRASSLESLQAGDLDVVFAVDMFNEGVDVPLIDTVLMLRPTESAIIWMQQFGRGLRKAAGKDLLKVVDYIGNHRTFFTKVRAMLQIGEGDRAIALALESISKGNWEFPPGCEVTYDLHAIDLIENLLRTDSGDALAAFYVDFCERHGQRPSAVEAFHAGYELKNTGHGSWFGFLRHMGTLNEGEAAVLEQHTDFLDDICKTRMTRSYKMLLLKAWLRRSETLEPVHIDELTEEVARLAHGNPHYADDISVEVSDKLKLRKLLVDNPIDAWTGEANSSPFIFQDDVFGLETMPTIDLAPALSELLIETVDWRLVEYLSRRELGPEPSSSESLADVANDPTGSSSQVGELWHEYMRDEIPPLFGDQFNPGSWNSGIVMSGKNMILLVTLKKENLSVGGHYEDGFVDPQTFTWQSQNRTTQQSNHGQIICGNEEGYNIHLYVRAGKLRGKKAAPFTYCGNVSFLSWEGEKPISVEWRLSAPLPDHYHRLFGIGKR